MILLIPYEVRTLFQRSPWFNLGIVVASVAVFLAMVFEWMPEEAIEAMILEGWTLTGLLGHIFLHAGWMHLIGNMLFLFVFGNAVCGVMNGWLYLLCYFACGTVAAAAHIVLDGSPAVGASGAVSGIMGMYIAIYPQNRIHCFWLFLIRGGTFDVPGWMLVVLWFILDLLGAFGGGGNVAHWAHVGGTVAGFAIGLALLKFGLVDIHDYDNPTVLDLIEDRFGAKD